MFSLLGKIVPELSNIYSNGSKFERNSVSAIKYITYCKTYCCDVNCGYYRAKVRTSLLCADNINNNRSEK
jgi:hypothetical protein